MMDFLSILLLIVFSPFVLVGMVWHCVKKAMRLGENIMILYFGGGN